MQSNDKVVTSSRDWAPSVPSDGRQNTEQSIIQMAVLYKATRGGISGSDRVRIIKRYYEKLGIDGNERTDDEKKVTKMNKKIMKLS